LNPPVIVDAVCDIGTLELVSGDNEPFGYLYDIDGYIIYSNWEFGADV